MKQIKFLLLTLLLNMTPIKAYRVRSASLPYVSGDSFRAICDFVIDESTTKVAPRVIPSLIQEGDTVFVRTEDLKTFFSITHPAIKKPYILVSHNSDLNCPGNYAAYLNDPKIIAWFGLNIDRAHPKLFPIPIGIVSDCNYFGGLGVGVLDSMTERKDRIAKDINLLINFTICTHRAERQYVYDLFSSQPYCTIRYDNNQIDYLTSLARSKFILSPRGTGQDCHRTWEAVLMGCIPIVKHSSIDSLYEGLPILVIDNWNEINELFLEQKYNELKSRTYNYERLYFTYWSRLITQARRNYFAKK